MKNFNSILAITGLLLTNGVSAQAIDSGQALSNNNTDIGRFSQNIPEFPSEFRSFDGSFNNLTDIEAGKANIELIRLTEANYGDGVSAMAGANLTNPRIISNEVLNQDELTKNRRRASSLLWQWGQFIDHDLDLTPAATPEEHEPIPVPLGDPLFDPFGSGIISIDFSRSQYNPFSGTSVSNPRQQLNLITAWIDASNVYGSSPERAFALRTLDGTGKLKTSENNLLPFNVDDLENDNGPNGGGANFFVAGDIRANEQVGLTSMHTLFVREHNRLVDEFNKEGIVGNEAYERARQLVGAFMQVITYNEFLPILLGNEDLPEYPGYDDSVDPSISNEFSTAAFRLGHSMLNPTLLRLDSEGNEIEHGHLPLRNAFFSPERLINEGGIDPILRGLAHQLALDIDTQIIDDVRNFLFGPPGASGLDLASLNIQRGRDHGLSSYNDAREAMGLSRHSNFSDINTTGPVRRKLRSVYSSVDDIDFWVGGLAERHVQRGLVGELFHAILTDQFTRLRDGDRFWYQNVFSGESLAKIERTKLSHIIIRNTNIRNREIRRNVFKVKRENTQ